MNYECTSDTVTVPAADSIVFVSLRAVRIASHSVRRLATRFALSEALNKTPLIRMGPFLTAPSRTTLSHPLCTQVTRQLTSALGDIALYHLAAFAAILDT